MASKVVAALAHALMEGKKAGVPKRRSELMEKAAAALKTLQQNACGRGEGGRERGRARHWTGRKRGERERPED